MEYRVDVTNPGESDAMMYLVRRWIIVLNQEWRASRKMGVVRRPGQFLSSAGLSASTSR